ncbi:hypothetical protein BGX31_008312 [Mortierella sp. GBA43]|nr:hypothetical protein BGX31_008312 [Mortierella sp. GBA43]
MQSGMQEPVQDGTRRPRVQAVAAGGEAAVPSSSLPSPSISSSSVLRTNRRFSTRPRATSHGSVQMQSQVLRFLHSDPTSIAADRTRARPGPGRPRRPKPSDPDNTSVFLEPLNEACPSDSPAASSPLPSGGGGGESSTTGMTEPKKPVPFEASPASMFLFVNEGNPMEKRDGRHKNCKMLEKEARIKARFDYEQRIKGRIDYEQQKLEQQKQKQQKQEMHKLQEQQQQHQAQSQQQWQHN